MANSDFYNITQKIIDKNLVVHAYLVKTDDNYDRCEIIDFIKRIIKSYDISEIEKDNIFDLINSNSFSDLIIIEPDGTWIKKEQILSLQSEYKTMSIYNKKRFYIIEFAENLNKHAFNTLLKFLEEPDNDIVALLITKNINLIAPTILSRCQVLNLINENITSFDLNIIEKSIKYLDILFSKKEKSIPYLTDLYNEETDTIKQIINIWINKIHNYLKEVMNNDDQSYQILEKIERKSLFNYINVLDLNINNFEKNYNNKLLIDKIIIEMFGVD